MSNPKLAILRRWGQIIISISDIVPQTRDTADIKAIAHTVIFIGLLHDGDHQGVIYRFDKENENHWDPLWGADADDLNKGDIISITSQPIYIMQLADTAGGGYSDMITNIEKLNNGRLSDFYGTNKKPIKYRSEWQYGDDFWKDKVVHMPVVDYFLAHTTDKKILKSLKRQTDTLYIHESRYEDDTEGMQQGECILMEMYDENNGKRKHVCTLVIEYYAMRSRSTTCWIKRPGNSGGSSNEEIYISAILGQDIFSFRHLPCFNITPNYFEHGVWFYFYRPAKYLILRRMAFL